MKRSSRYRTQLHNIKASFPRFPDSSNPDFPADALQIAYRKYTATSSQPAHAKVFNLVFLHGTGMNKGIWHYHIDKLYQKCHSIDVHVNVVLAIDAVNHGHLAQINRGKLGKNFDYRDFALDAAKVCQAEHETLKFAKTIIVGHSMAAFVSLIAVYMYPTMFESCVLLNPTCYQPNTEYDTPYEPFLTWERKKYMETEFYFGVGENWKEKIIEYMGTKGLYRGFNREVLANMMEDEFPPEPEVRGLGEGASVYVELNTSKKQTLITYFGGLEALLKTTPIFAGVQVPVYRILGEFDTAKEADRRRLEMAMPKMKTIYLKGQKHLVQGTRPDMFVELMMEILEARKFAEPTVFPYLDLTLRLKL